jgi:hypothetical protein
VCLGSASLLFRNQQKSYLRLFVTWQLLELQPAFHETTIESYVKDQLTPKLDQWFQKAGMDPVQFFGDDSKGHKGMFIWVSTMLTYLKDTYTFEEFQKVLKDVPPSINALYRASLDRLASSHSETQNIWIKETSKSRSSR